MYWLREFSGIVFESRLLEGGEVSGRGSFGKAVDWNVGELGGAVNGATAIDLGTSGPCGEDPGVAPLVAADAEFCAGADVSAALEASAAIPAGESKSRLFSVDVEVAVM